MPWWADGCVNLFLTISRFGLPNAIAFGITRQSDAFFVGYCKRWIALVCRRFLADFGRRFTWSRSEKGLVR